MRCLVTDAAALVGSPPGESWLADGYGVCGIDVFIDYYSLQIKEQKLSIAPSWRHFTFISDIVKIKNQAASSENAVSQAVDIVEGPCVSLYETM